MTLKEYKKDDLNKIKFGSFKGNCLHLIDIHRDNLKEAILCVEGYIKDGKLYPKLDFIVRTNEKSYLQTYNIDFFEKDLIEYLIKQFKREFKKLGYKLSEA